MNPFFFGTSERQLFGIHQPPEGPDLDAAVLICPPLGHEYIASHRSLFQLAGRLTRAGCHVLRFDFFGCGDSAGDLPDATVEQWIADVHSALQELRDSSGVRRVCLVGLRLGAALATIAAVQERTEGRSDLAAAVLWEPVVRGSAYLAELEAAQRDWLRGGFPKPKRGIVNALGPEFLGFAMPERLQQGIAAIDLAALQDQPADRVLLLQNVEGAHLEPLRARWTALGGRLELSKLPARRAWIGEHRATIVVPPAEVTQAIAAWVTEALR